MSEDGSEYSQFTFETPQLRGLVGAPWCMSYGASAEALPGIVAPDAHVEFVFQTGAPCATRPAAGRPAAPSPAAMVYAQRHGALTLIPTGANTIVAFRTTPAVASVILGRPLADCWDRPIDLAEMIGAEAHSLLDRLAGTPLARRGALLETWLVSRLGEWGLEHACNLRLQRALLWSWCEESVADLADEVGVSARTLRRQFAKHAGITPKQLSLSGRILRACAWLSDRRDLPIAEVALRVGFSDQAAFTNAFRHYVGMTPAHLRAEPIVFCERLGF